MNRGRLIALDTPAALRERFGRAAPRGARPTTAPRAAELLEEAPGVAGAGLFGRAVHVTLAPSADVATRGRDRAPARRPRPRGRVDRGDRAVARGRVHRAHRGGRRRAGDVSLTPPPRDRPQGGASSSGGTPAACPRLPAAGAAPACSSAMPSPGTCATSPSRCWTATARPRSRELRRRLPRLRLLHDRRQPRPAGRDRRRSSTAAPPRWRW